MLESVPAFVETAIYLYFAAVATMGLYLHGRLWRTSRVAGEESVEDASPRTDLESLE